MVIREPEFVWECVKNFALKKRVKGVDGKSFWVSGHHQEGFQGVRDSRMCQSTKENSWQLKRKKVWSHQVSIDN